MGIPYDVEKAGLAEEYLTLVGRGTSERLAEMLVLQSPPGLRGTDRAFMEGRMNNQQFDALPKLQAQYMLREAKKSGINPAGKYYVAGLADKRGWKDPEAWVSSVDDVKKVAIKRNLNVEGAVNHKAREIPPKHVKLAEDIVREEVRKAKRKNPTAKVGELREAIIEKHSYRRRAR